MTTTTENPSHAEVQWGDNLRTFAERHGVDHRRLIDLNAEQLEADARTRGFDGARFRRAVPDDDGGAVHPDSNQTITWEPDAHVFAGQRLRLRPPEEGDPDYKE